MEILFEIIKICVPAILVLIAMQMMMKQNDIKEEKRLEAKRKKPLSKAILPIKLQAYERLVIFLERIAPENLIQRTQTANMTARELQSALIKNIRQEYEHNLAQQLYISEDSWKAVLFTKESLSNLINSAYSAMPENATSFQLAQSIIETYRGTDSTPTDEAIHQLKNEIIELLD